MELIKNNKKSFIGIAVAIGLAVIVLIIINRVNYPISGTYYSPLLGKYKFGRGTVTIQYDDGDEVKGKYTMDGDTVQIRLEDGYGDDWTYDRSSDILYTHLAGFYIELKNVKEQ